MIIFVSRNNSKDEIGNDEPMVISDNNNVDNSNIDEFETETTSKKILNNFSTNNNNSFKSSIASGKNKSKEFFEDIIPKSLGDLEDNGDYQVEEL